MLQQQLIRSGSRSNNTLQIWHKVCTSPKRVLLENLFESLLDVHAQVLRMKTFHETLDPQFTNRLHVRKSFTWPPLFSAIAFPLSISMVTVVCWILVAKTTLKRTHPSWKHGSPCRDKLLYSKPDRGRDLAQKFVGTVGMPFQCCEVSPISIEFLTERALAHLCPISLEFFQNYRFPYWIQSAACTSWKTWWLHVWNQGHGKNCSDGILCYLGYSDKSLADRHCSRLTELKSHELRTAVDRNEVMSCDSCTWLMRHICKTSAIASRVIGF